MRYPVFLLSSLLLISCSAPSTSSSSDAPLPPIESSPKDEKAEIQTFLQDLSALEDRVHAVTFEGEVTTGFNLSVEPLYISGKQNGRKELFSLPETSKFLLTKGSEQIGSDPATLFEEQLFVMDPFLYKIRLDQGSNMPSKEKAVYQPENHDNLFHLSFIQEQQFILGSFLTFFGQEKVETTCSIPSFNGDGSYHLEYGITLLTHEGYPDQKVHYSYDFTVENSKVVTSSALLKNSRYLAAKEHESQHSKIKNTYHYGQMKPFEGTFFDPSI